MFRHLVLVAIAAATAGIPDAKAAPPVAYLYHLSDFSGTVPYNDVVLRPDRLHDEIYAVAGNTVRVFNGAGMEIYEFDEDPVAGQVVDLAVLDSGDILLLIHPQAPVPGEPDWLIRRCDYRGVPEANLPAMVLPADFGAFRPEVMLYRDGHLFLADKSRLRAVEADPAGTFRRALDLGKMIGLSEADRARNEVSGLSLDAHGRILLTIPTLPKAYVLSPDGTAKGFGRAGSVPGSFGIPAGIVADDHGRFLVADKGRSVVLIFGPALEFLGEFGDENTLTGLIRPSELAIGNDDKVYVTQVRERGVPVYRIAPAGTSSPAP